MKSNIVKGKALTFVILTLIIQFPAYSRNQPKSVEKLLQGDDAITLTGDGGEKSPTITLGKNFGGSVVSLYYRGVEYVNNVNSEGLPDRGRQLQSAVQYRDAKECFNPTEAGGKYDVGQLDSHSKLLSVQRPDKTTIMTETDMAFWMAPGQKVADKRKQCTAINKDFRGGYILNRTIRVGMKDYPNVIQYNIKFRAPSIEKKARYVPIATHSPQNFTRVFSVSNSGQLKEVLKKKNQRGKLPYIVSTDDERNAVIVCNKSPLSSDDFYGYTRFPNTITSRFVSFAKSPEKESREFENYVIVGTLDEVKNASTKFCF